jgi:predicted nucleotidyltransferase
VKYVIKKEPILLEGSESKKYNFPDPYHFGTAYCPIFPPRHKTMKAVLDNIPETIEVVYVFGSSIRFDTGIDSDLDVLLLGTLSNDEYKKICNAVPKGEKLDLLVETKERFLSLLDDTWSSLYKRIYLRGYKIYERQRAV